MTDERPVIYEVRREPAVPDPLSPEQRAELSKQRRTPQEIAISQVAGALLNVEAAHAIYGGSPFFREAFVAAHRRLMRLRRALEEAQP